MAKTGMHLPEVSEALYATGMPEVFEALCATAMA